ncbi:cyclodeaminase/cyclohydrolase family protein [Amycolatopsis alkalitolerans]|uniref:cyclodeaminase/cyclohydrolase family protein n=1 Tax=Amycolatopsis alkalitolerans TaxID=2547244 RepID=UPI00135A9201|nr:cyclodeaminase/cyclohydrolase family protein [Amycolatopsis alkalitolerans]
MSSSFRALSVAKFLSAIAAKQPAPGGGAAAAMTAATAAGLTAMAARYSEDVLRDAVDLAREADRLRDRVIRLADADAEAYRAVLEAYALPRTDDLEERRERIRSALQWAAEVPLEIADIAASVVKLAARLAEGGNAHLRGDAFTAVCLAEAAVRSAATLVQINAKTGKLGDELVDGAECLVRLAADSAGRAVSENGG